MHKFSKTMSATALIALLVGQQLAFASEKEEDEEGHKKQLQGYYTHEPWTGGTPANAAFNALAGTTIPLFTYSYAATKDASTRNGTMVGTSPFAATLTGSTISTLVVPLKITIGANVFDPSAPNACDSGISAVSRFMFSPLVANVTNLTMNGVNVGNTQYINGVRRAEFWNKIAGSAAYQNTLSPVVVTATQSVTSPNGTTYSSGCSQMGIVGYSWLSSYLKNTLLPALNASGVGGPSKFIVILLKNVVQSQSNPPSVNNCCILGFHGATGNPVQTYSPIDWDTTGLFNGVADGSIAAHEIGEWMDDPLGTNPTPAWGNIGQVSGCQGNLENGDPLSGKLMPAYTLAGKAYHMQELAYFSWFFNKLGVASLGTGGKYSSNGTFGGPSKACPSGGTN